MRSSLATWMVAAALATAAAACASSENVDDGSGSDTGATDTGATDTGATDVSTDTGADTTTDTGVDTAEDAAPDTPTEDVVEDTPDEDTEPDVPGFDCEVLAGECDPTAVYCADATTIAFCSRCGEVLFEEACDVAEVCDDSAGIAECRPCEGDECPDNIECEAGERSCLDYQTVQICGADGEIETTSPCPAGRRCFEGSCGSEGGDAGASCTTNIDTETGCSGHLCVCGTEWVEANGADGCGAGLSEGYCAGLDCGLNGCDDDTEICADFGPSGTWGGDSFCILTEDCEARGRACGRPGMVCQELPIDRGEDRRMEWDMGCWPGGLSPIGGSCAADSDCVGGRCLTRTVAGAPVSYCASPCGDDAGCPSNATCVVDRDTPGEFLCLANANASDCPRLDSEPLFIRSSPPLERYDGGTTSVCFFASR